MKNKENYLLYGLLLIVTVAALFYTFFTFFDFQISGFVVQEQNAHHTKTSNALLTEFDSQLAKQFMDKDNDGRCDICGMDVNLCIQSGQLQCNMDPKSTIGVLGSAHTHADFKVYINGKPLNFADFNYYMKSSFIHLDESQNKEASSGVLHMHATGVPLWIFFKSIEGKFNESCLAVSDSQIFCNDANKNVKFYVNNKPNNEFGNYVFKDLDKILISYGDINENVQEQLRSITDFAKEH